MIHAIGIRLRLWEYEPGGLALNPSRARRGSGEADVAVGRDSNPSRAKGCWESWGHLGAVGLNNKSARMNIG